MGKIAKITAPLPRSFYLRPARQVARSLLGQRLCRETEEGIVTARIVEVEAYLGADDPAAHAYRGPTARNAVLFGPAGYAYVYFIYGRYFCFNVSCQTEGKAGCVLFRAVEPLEGVDWLRRQRAKAAGIPPQKLPENFASGPSRLCQAFALTRSVHNGVDLTRRDSGLWLAEGPGLKREEGIATSPRIGIKENVDAPLRFYLHGKHQDNLLKN
jgi:DNA-3-methyladenine glycosylase